MNRLLTRLALTCAVIAVTPATQDPTARSQPARAAETLNCRADGQLVRQPDLPEGSGVAASRRNPGILWAHNDSGKPVVLKLDEHGTTLGRLRISGAGVEDWEDIAVGPCGPESCLYIGDIGDNDGEREHITLYRAAEPAREASETSAAKVFRATYPDGTHDAESLFVTSDAEIFIITKGDPGPVALYRFPRPLRSDVVMQLERVGNPLRSAGVRADDRPTAADASPDGAWVGVRTTAYAALYRTADLTAGHWLEMSRVDLTTVNEPRGEGITFGANGAIFLVGEGASLSRAGTFARLACTIPSR